MALTPHRPPVLAAIAFRARALGVIVALAQLGASGCVPCFISTDLRAGGPLPAWTVRAIRPGTPARDVLAGLGPPTAVARHGETIAVPRYADRREGSRELSADALFAPFEEVAPAGPRDLVYLYESFESHRRFSSFALLVVPLKGALGGESTELPGTVEVTRLLILIDGERRVVLDTLRHRTTEVLHPRLPSGRAP